MNPSSFWSPWEGKRLPDFEAADNVIRSIVAEHPGHQFAWRGVANAEWPLHSSLYRRMLWTRRAADSTAKPPDEPAMAAEEARVIRDARRWGVHSGPRGHLSFLEFLATLQHFGAPTRLIDVTFNPYVALFFAVEAREHDSADGRLFAVDVKDRLINDVPTFSEWENDFNAPWAKAGAEWTAATFAWRPSGFDRRIAAQQGGFLLAGVPDTKAGQWPKGPKASSARWSIAETREVVSVPIRAHKLDGAGKQASQPMYTVRVAARAKKGIRAVLSDLFGLDYANVYPDVPGFAQFGTDYLRGKPP